MENVTRFGLAVVTHEPDSGCEFWPVAPPERYLGPWNKTLANPILIVSNTVRLTEFHLVVDVLKLIYSHSFCSSTP